jgi:hypothetical protein
MGNAKRRTPEVNVPLERRSRRLLADDEHLFPVGSLRLFETDVLDREFAPRLEDRGVFGVAARFRSPCCFPTNRHLHRRGCCRTW